MGGKSKRLARLAAAHPVCYFCATRSTESEDHVPSRECFRQRVGPEGFSFPACKACNNGAGQLEQVVALYLLMADHSEAGDIGDQLQRLVNGVHNNNPDLLPQVTLRANLARKHFREKKLTLPPGQTYSQSPIATLPPGHGIAFKIFLFAAWPARYIIRKSENQSRLNIVSREHGYLGTRRNPVTVLQMQYNYSRSFV